MVIAPAGTCPGLRVEREGVPACEPVPVDWSALVPRLVHPTKVVILEAMLWIGRPMSATELEELACGDTALKSFSYHLKRLIEAGVLEVVGKLKVRRATSAKKETFFFFVGQYRWIFAVLDDTCDPLMAAALSRAASLPSTDKETTTEGPFAD
jgi:DNA-binding transcriptional ArsR family regulator